MLEDLASSGSASSTDLISSVDGATDLATKIDWTFLVPMTTTPSSHPQTMGKMQATGTTTSH